MKVRFSKLHDKAVIPSYAKDDDAGLDLTCVSYEYDNITKTFNYSFGLAAEVPSGHVGFLFARSSIANKDLVLVNGTGVLDAGYRGILGAKFRATCDNPRIYNVGDRVAQLVIVPIPKIEPVLVKYNELSQSERGQGGWGSSGS